MYTTIDLISQVRSLLNEENFANLDDIKDILPALNRAQDVASNLLARHYESPLLTHKDLTLETGEHEYDIPEDAFEQRLEKVEVNINGFFYPVERVSYRDAAIYESPSSTNVPNYYVEVGRKFRLLPSPVASYPIRVWYLREPAELVLPVGRVIKIGSDYVTLQMLHPELVSEDITSRESFVNIVDEQTGLIKATLQVKSEDDGRLTFKTSPTRDTVYTRDVVTALPETLTLDDYVCPASGSCISFMKRPFSNYLIQYAVLDLRKKFGDTEALQAESLAKKELEEIVERSWVGRPNSLRVKRSSRNWLTQARRFWHGGQN